MPRPEVPRPLESGKDVVTPLAYHLSEARREGPREELEAACQKGQSTFHADGLNPGWVMERLTPVLTNLSHDIEHIKVEECFDCARSSEPMITVMGLGMPVEQAKEMVIAREMVGRLPAEVAMGVLMHSLLDRTLVPPGSDGESLYVFLPAVPHELDDGRDWGEAKGAYHEHVLDVRTTATRPGLRESVLGSYVKTPKELAEQAFKGSG
ncbi:MAG: hypothetical protein WD844_11725 [Thermoleophilaceae bacterium]